MFCKVAIFLAFVTLANAGYLSPPVFSDGSYTYASPQVVAAPTAIVSQQSNILRSQGNSGQVSSYSKSINTPHSSVYKTDVRVSNDAVAFPYAHGYAVSPAYGQAYTTPIYSHNYLAPSYSNGYSVPAYAHNYATHAPTGILGVAYSPATAAAHFSYSNGYGLHYSY